MIPKILHQIWIGPKERPSKFMDSWHTNNPDFEYIFWNEEEIKKRNFKFKCQQKIDEIEEILEKELKVIKLVKIKGRNDPEIKNMVYFF